MLVLFLLIKEDILWFWIVMSCLIWFYYWFSLHTRLVHIRKNCIIKKENTTIKLKKQKPDPVGVFFIKPGFFQPWPTIVDCIMNTPVHKKKIICTFAVLDFSWAGLASVLLYPFDPEMKISLIYISRTSLSYNTIAY